MRAINDAWATLGDPDRRARYDRALAATTTGARAAQPHQPPRPWEWPAEDDLDPDLDPDVDLDDRPIHGHVRLPRWLSLLPVGLFAASVLLMVVGAVLASAPLVGLAGVCFVLSCLFFLAAPFVALLLAQRPDR
jgi:hypothetical protein